MKILITFVLVVFNVLINAQEQYPKFPQDQHSYLGGDKQFFKEFHNILIDKKFKPCENKGEHPVISFLIKTDGSAEIVNVDDEKLEQNKCTFALTTEVIKYISNWIPAKIDGKETPAVKKYFIAPDDLFDKFKDGYIDAENTDFDKELFIKEVTKNINLSKIDYKGKLTVIIKFKINTEGNIDQIMVEKSSDSKKFDDAVIDAVQKSKDKIHSNPGIFLGKPINLYFRIPFSVSLN